MDEQAQLAQAKKLIQSKRYEDAKTLLITIDHPTADKWLARLNGMGGMSQKSQVRVQVRMQEISDELESRKSQRTAAAIWSLMALITLIGWPILPLTLFNYVRHGRAVKRLQRERKALIASLE